MNAVTEFNQGGAVAVHGAYDPFAAYGAEAVTGDFLKFSKGEWLKGQNDEEIELGRLLAANVEELSIGWIRWEDGKPAERRMGLLGQGHKPEPRGDLGFTDPALWETDKDGKPQDPWNFTNELPLADPETGEQMTLSASSKGGIGCVRALCKAFVKGRAANPGLVPIVELARDSYKHKEYGKTYVPVLNIVDWVANGEIPDAPASNNDEDDDAPAKETPTATKAAGAKTRF